MAITVDERGVRRFSTKEDLAKLKGEEKPYFIWDGGFSGDGPGGGRLGVRVAPSGDGAIWVQYRLENGKTTKQSLHKLKAWLAAGASLPQLRAEARTVIDGGKSTGLSTTQAKTTIREAGEAYLAHRAANKPYINRGKGKGTEGALQDAIDRAEKVWGNRPLSKLTTTDGEKLMAYIRDNFGPTTALKARSLLPTVLKYAKRTQPTVNADVFKGMELADGFFLTDERKNGEEKPVLTAEQRPRYFDALREIELAEGADTGRPREAVEDKCDFLRLTYLCAARKQDWYQATWGDIDWETRDWTRDERKKGGHTMKLPEAALPILERVKARREAEEKAGDGDLVFGTFSTTTLRDVHKLALEKAKIDPRLTIHDLKASRVTQYHIEQKLTTTEIGFMIGNKDVATLIRHYVRDSASEEEKLDRVNAKGDDLI